MIPTGANPLLSSPALSNVPVWLTNRSALMEALTFQPFVRSELPVENAVERLLLTDEVKRTFVTAPQFVRIAVQILRVLYRGLKHRDPTDPSVRTDLNASTRHLGKDMSRVPWYPTYAQGIVIEGMTGLGKSHVVERVMRLLPQVVVHDNPASDWGVKYLKQLVWLKVSMPADHSRKGLLIHILKQMDLVLETTYYDQHFKVGASIEQLLVVITCLLAQHRCGMLIIEEAQVENLGAPALSRDFLNFFLRVLNWGIPIVLIGNPLAFVHLRQHAQDVDRFSEGGWFSLLPEAGPHSKVWSEIWMPMLWGANLTGVRDADFEPAFQFPEASSWNELIWRLTGGIPRFVSRLRIETLNRVLNGGGGPITTTLVAEVFNQSATLSVSRRRIEALALRKVEVLRTFTDMPVDQLQAFWLANPSSWAAQASSSPMHATPAGQLLEGSASLPLKAAHPRLKADRAISPEARMREQLCNDITSATEVASRGARRRSGSK